MAEAVATLANMVLINDRNLSEIEIPNFFSNSPFMRTNAATTASYDTKHRWIRHADPAVAARAVNDGREVQKSVDTMVEIDLKILDGSFRVDRELVREYHRGGQAGWLNRELARHLNAMMFHSEKQVFRGTANDSLYFSGFPNVTELATIGGGGVISAGGSTASSQTSAYVVRSGSMDVEIVTGYSGSIAVGEPTIQETTGATTGTFPAIYVAVGGWYGLKVGSTVTSVKRIANIESSFTDDHIYAAIKEFDSGRQPTHIYCSRKALELLRSSRTATNISGDPAGRPTTIEGIPIIPTDGISVTEAVVT